MTPWPCGPCGGDVPWANVMVPGGEIQLWPAESGNEHFETEPVSFMFWPIFHKWLDMIAGCLIVSHIWRVFKRSLASKTSRRKQRDLQQRLKGADGDQVPITLGSEFVAPGRAEFFWPTVTWCWQVLQLFQQEGCSFDKIHLLTAMRAVVFLGTTLGLDPENVSQYVIIGRLQEILGVGTSNAKIVFFFENRTL